MASTFYCHFTSPNRRYPDLYIHRIISKYLDQDQKDVLNSRRGRTVGKRFEGRRNQQRRYSNQNRFRNDRDGENRRQGDRNNRRGGFRQNDRRRSNNQPRGYGNYTANYGKK